MTSIRTLIVMICVTALAPLAFGQSAPTAPTAPSAPPAPPAASAPPPRIKPADAKNHLGETVTVCGKVVDNRKVPKYGLGGYGKPISFDLDQPESNSVFYFVTFGVLPEGSKHGAAAPPADAPPNGGAPVSGAPPPAGAPPVANAPPAANAQPPAGAPPVANAPPAANAPPTADAPPVAGGPPAAAKPSGPEEVIAAYKDKRVCVTGKIAVTGSSSGPFILQPDRSQIKIQEENK